MIIMTTEASNVNIALASIPRNSCPGRKGWNQWIHLLYVLGTSWKPVYQSTYLSHLGKQAMHGTVDSSLGQTAHLTNTYLHIKAYFKTITSLRLPKILHHGCIPVPDGARPHTERPTLNHVSPDPRVLWKSAPDLNLLSHFWVMVFSLTAAGLINLSLLDKQVIWWSLGRRFGTVDNVWE